MNLVDDQVINQPDDGNVLPIRIGIAPSPDKPPVRVLRVNVPVDSDGNRVLPLIDTDDSDMPVIGVTKSDILRNEITRHQAANPESKVLILGPTGEPVSPLTWASYLEWRKTKCKVRDIEPGFVGYEHMKEKFPEELKNHMEYERLEEIDQATHEMVGEVAELGQLFLEHGPTVFFGDMRAKLLDEIGDIFFCSVWALDAWGSNPLYEAEGLDLIHVHPDGDLVSLANFLAKFGEESLGDQQFVSMLGGLIFNLMLTAQTNAGLTANAFKKLRFQRREQPVEVQVARIGTVLQAVSQILVLAGSTVEEALKVNQRKLNSRYPDGYVSGQGGGIRTGEGK